GFWAPGSSAAGSESNPRNPSRSSRGSIEGLGIPLLQARLVDPFRGRRGCASWGVRVASVLKTLGLGRCDRGELPLQHSDLRAWPVAPKPSFWQSVAAGSAILLLSVLLRLGLDQVIPGRLAFTTYFPATVLAAYLTGTPGGLIVLAGGLIGSWFTWLGPTTPLNFAVALIGDGVFGITG